MGLSAKEDVKIFGSRPEIVWCDMVMLGVFAEFNNAECVVTSGVEGVHGDHSHHYKGFARDYRIRHIPQGWWEKLAERARKALTKEFQIILHKGPSPPPHLHVEFDPQRGLNA